MYRKSCYKEEIRIREKKEAKINLKKEGRKIY